MLACFKLASVITVTSISTPRAGVRKSARHPSTWPFPSNLEVTRRYETWPEAKDRVCLKLRQVWAQKVKNNNTKNSSGEAEGRCLWPWCWNHHRAGSGGQLLGRDCQDALKGTRLKQWIKIAEKNKPCVHFGGHEYLLGLKRRKLSFANETKRGEKSKCFLSMNHLVGVRVTVKIAIASWHPRWNRGSWDGDLLTSEGKRRRLFKLFQPLHCC